jgi:hypothetical protein
MNKWKELLFAMVSVDRRETTTGMNPVAEETAAHYLISPFFQW